MLDTAKHKGKHLLLHKETLLLILILVSALFITTTIFLVLWSFFKIGFVWVLCFLLFFLARKTDFYKYGFEIHFFLIFVTTYLFSFWFSVPLFILGLFSVWRIRPDEFEGCLIHFAGLLFIVIAASIISSRFGLAVSSSAFFWASMIIVSIGIIIDFLLTLRVHPQLWMRLIIGHLLDIFIQYSALSAFGFTIFKLLLAFA